MIGDGASYEFRWRRWALLRDFIQAALDRGADEPKYPRFCELGRALVEPVATFPAQALAAELAALKLALVNHTVEDLVIGPQTAATIYLGKGPFPGARKLTHVELAAIGGPGSTTNLAEYFDSMVDSMATVCAHPFATGLVEVMDG